MGFFTAFKMSGGQNERGDRMSVPPRGSPFKKQRRMPLFFDLNAYYSNPNNSLGEMSNRLHRYTIFS